MKSRFTYRPNYHARKKINMILRLLKLHYQKMSTNNLINIIINDRLRNVNLSSNDLKNLKKNYSGKDYKDIAKSLAKINNQLNYMNRFFNGGYNNLNQLTKKVNSGKINLSKNDLNKYKRLVIDSKKSTKLMEGVITKLWQKI